MRQSDRGFTAHLGENQLFNVDFHDFIRREQATTSIELASEFGLTLRDVKKLKKRLERS